MPIITSILDLDLYKLTVGEVIFTYFRNIKAKYRMTVRNADKIDFWGYHPNHLFDPEIKSLEELSLTAKEAEYLRGLNLFSEAYIQFLMDKPMKGCSIFSHFYGPMGNGLPEISGEWCRVMLYETFCLSINNEIFAECYAARNDIDMNAVVKCGRIRLKKKIENLNGYKKTLNSSHHPLDITEFGTRRRLSKMWQREVLFTLNANDIITGTSNVHLAMEKGIPCRGTFGHEFPMGLQGIVRPQDSQIEAFNLWLAHWKGKLAIALDDTLGTDKFLRDFTKELAEKFDGLRHDSGHWKEWTERRILMYHHLRVDAEKKVLFYSDGLDDYAVKQIHELVRKRAIPKFGIGTFFTNDTFLPVPQSVMKIIECNGQPVAKLSNNPEGKTSCISPEYLEYIKYVARRL